MKMILLLALALTAMALGATDNLEEPLTIDKVVTFLGEHPEITTIEQLLPRLPKMFRRRSVFAFHSRSRQSGTPDEPRVILMSADASFVLAFSGKPGPGAGNEIEMLNVKKGEKEPFQFGSYSFNPTLGKKREGFSGINPQLCRGCHERQGVMRPIWEPYNFWGGFFGERNDPNYGPNEMSFFKRFKHTLEHSPGRFESLFDDVSKVTPTSIHLAPDASIGSSRTCNQQADERTNLRRLSHNFNYHNFDRVYSVLKTKPYYQKIRFALLAALMECHRSHRIDQFLPDAVNEAMQAHGLSADEVARQSLASYLKSSRERVRRAADKDDYDYKDPQPYEPGYQRMIQGARYVMLSQGDDIYDWFLTLESEIGSFSVERDQEQYLANLILEDVLKDHPELQDKIEVGGYFIALPFPPPEKIPADAKFRKFACVKLDSSKLTGTTTQEYQRQSSAQYRPFCEELRQRSLEAFEREETKQAHGKAPKATATHAAATR